MPKDNFLILEDFKPGWFKRGDDSRIPIGGSRTSVNITQTERGGIAPRPGEELLGTLIEGGDPGKSLFSFKKSEGDDILMKTYGTKLEFYSNKKSKWSLIKDGYTSGQRFGFAATRLDATDTIDWASFGNGIDNFSRWCGYDGFLDGALSGGETEVIVDTILLERVHHSDTSDASTTTTVITLASGTPWVADQWNDNFYVRITSGAKSGFISKITDTTTNSITFDAITGLSGAVTFEIRQIAVPATGTLIYNDTELVYTGVPQDDRFTVAIAHASAGSDDVVTIVPTEYPGNPKGNLFEVKDEALYVAGMADAPVTVNRSNNNDLDNFALSDPRAANEADLVYFPYGGKKITSLNRFEGEIAVLKPDSVDLLTYSDVYDPDTNAKTDVSNRDSVKSANSAGSAGRAWQVGDDIQFATPDNRINTVGRLKYNDERPKSQDIAYDIRREVKSYDFSNVDGIEHINQIFITAKSTSDVTANDRVLVRNKDYGPRNNGSWEGYWLIQASDFAQHEGNLYYIDSLSPNVYKMLTGTNKKSGSNTFPMTATWQSGWINGRGSAFYLNEISTLAVEGRIRLNTTITFKLYKDYASTEFVELQYQAIENTATLDGEDPFSVLGGLSNGLEPLGAPSFLGAEEADGYRHFVAYLQFPITQVEYVSIEVGSSGKNQAWEITRLGINATENVFEAQSRIISSS